MSKTPEQIAEDLAADWTAEGETKSADYRLALEAIRADRAQRTLYDAVADALEDRGAHAHAEFIRAGKDDPGAGLPGSVWGDILGPFLDHIQDNFGV